MDHNLMQAMDHFAYMDSRPVERYICECCGEKFYTGQISFCKEEGVYFSNDCILRGNHLYYFEGGTMTKDQILNIHKTFLSV